MAVDHIKRMLEEKPYLYVYKTKILRLVNEDQYFLHIPKCGGTSVRDGLIYSSYMHNKPKLDYLDHHNHSKAQHLSESIDITRSKFIVSVRHPVARFLSSYNFLIDIDQRNIERNNSDQEFYQSRKGYLENLGIDGFCDLLKDIEQRRAIKAQWFANEQGHFDWAFEPQTLWLKGTTKELVKYYKIETPDIFERLSIPVHHSKMKSYNRQVGLENKQQILDYFAKDFDRFKYTLSDQWDAHHLLNERSNVPALPVKLLKRLQGGFKVLKP